MQIHSSGQRFSQALHKLGPLHQHIRGDDLPFSFLPDPSRAEDLTKELRELIPTHSSLSYKSPFGQLHELSCRKSAMGKEMTIMPLHPREVDMMQGMGERT